MYLILCIFVEASLQLQFGLIINSEGLKWCMVPIGTYFLSMLILLDGYKIGKITYNKLSHSVVSCQVRKNGIF